MQLSRRQQRAQQAPKGKTPFSQPNLFAGSRAPRRNPKGRGLQSTGRVSAPSAQTRVMKGLQGTPDQSILVRRREYVGDILGSVTYSNTSFNCNPGLASLFPWLSQIAPSYDQHSEISLAFLFEPEQASTATGAVILSFDYDATDPAPVDKVSALETKDSVRAAPWVPCRLQLNPSDLKRRCAEALFVRTGTVTNTDIKTYDLGVLNVSTVGQASTATVGELWVEYTIRLSVPQRAVPPGQQLTVSSASKTAPFTGTQAISGNSLVATATGAVLTFQVAGYYQIDHYIVGTVLTAIGTPTASTGSSCSSLIGAQIPTAATTGLATFTCRMLAGGTLTFDDATGNSTVTLTQTQIAPWFTG